ncbi:ABC transporter permease [Rhizomonospora bruguierae]|uniref:ABC transporter permease n=1 Tax=Rhizomonospora bruguierae TaxID=1581705 RepID=UPI001BCBDD77|nr:ABC transporter permease [Micromonospora sp. NBRC 107566]
MTKIETLAPSSALPQTRRGAPGQRAPRRYTYLPPVAAVLGVLLLWEAVVRIADIREIVLPTPTRILKEAIANAPLYLEASWVTFVESVVGFLLACVLGLALGTAIALSRVFSTTIYPILVASQVTPKVAIAPLVIIWFGFGASSKIALTTLIAFFPVVLDTVVGLNRTTRDGLNLFRILGASSRQTFWKLQIPGALPMIFSGIKVASTLAVIGAVIGEFAGSSSGLGYLLMVQSGQIQTAAAFANIFYLTVMGMVLFGAVVLVERLVVPRHMLIASEGV